MPNPVSPDVPVSSAQTVLQPAIDIRGKTRAQIKAEEYERNCGQVWKDYHQCLKVRLICPDLC